MDALKLIPQSFFEFFARLVPGGVAFAIWMSLFGGAYRWPIMLETLAAGRLDPGNISIFAFFSFISIAYGLGQLVAPLGKAAQRVTEFLTVPAARILLKPRNWARGVMKKDLINLRRLKKEGEGEGDYDYLRANAADLGALVAKIRSEQTMFYSLSAIFAIAAIAYSVVRSGTFLRALPLLISAAIICACRGYFVRKTMGETARKLRRAFDQVRAERSPEARVQR